MRIINIAPRHARALALAMIWAGAIAVFIGVGIAAAKFAPRYAACVHAAAPPWAPSMSGVTGR